MAFLTPAAPAHRARRQRAIGAATASLPTPDDAVSTILATIGRGPEHVLQEGLGWYLAANSIARDISTDTGVAVAQCAGVLAALSPQTSWAENIRLAHEACSDPTTPTTGHTTDATDKADRILTGEDPLAVLGGRKVRSFYRNILTPTTAGPVTVDRHAIDLLVGRKGAVNDRILERPGAYVYAAAAYRAAARELAILPHQAQAIAWLVWRHETDVLARHADPSGRPLEF